MWTLALLSVALLNAAEAINGCDRLCYNNSLVLTCRIRVLWASSHKFRGQRSACYHAHSWVLDTCGSCSDCSLESLGPGCVADEGTDTTTSSNSATRTSVSSIASSSKTSAGSVGNSSSSKHATSQNGHAINETAGRDEEKEENDEDGFCCTAATNDADYCGSCWVGAPSMQPEYCLKSKAKCQECGQVWCNVTKLSAEHESATAHPFFPLAGTNAVTSTTEDDPETRRAETHEESGGESQVRGSKPEGQKAEGDRASGVNQSKSNSTSSGLLCADLGSCSHQYDSSLECQCNIHCSEFDDCCSDYVKMCSQPLRSLVDSDSNGGFCVDYGCSLEYRPLFACQCNPACVQHGSCCSDYSAECQPQVLMETADVQQARQTRLRAPAPRAWLAAMAVAAAMVAFALVGVRRRLLTPTEAARARRLLTRTEPISDEADMEQIQELAPTESICEAARIAE